MKRSINYYADNNNHFCWRCKSLVPTREVPTAVAVNTGEVYSQDLCSKCAAEIEGKPLEKVIRYVKPIAESSTEDENTNQKM